MKPHMLKIAAAGALLLSAAPAVASEESLRLEPISFRASNGTIVQAERGSFKVPENRANPKSRRISVSFVRFPSTNPTPGAPIVYLAGGPGGTGSGAAAGPRFPIFQALREVADVIAFDQRGTGPDADLFACRAEEAPDPRRPMSRENFAAYYDTAVRQCWNFWHGKGIDIGGYNTRESAADLDELRRQLGARRINLWGISYGTHLALAMMKYHPRSVERVVLASAEGPDQTVKLPQRVDSALKRLATAGGVPDLPAQMRRVHERLDRKPLRLTHDPEGSPGTSFTLTSYPIQLMAASMVKNPSELPRLVQLYAALDVGAWDALTPVIYEAFWKNRLTLEAMPTAMDLASGISPGRRALVEQQRSSSVLSDALNFPFPQVFSAVPQADLGEEFRRDFRSGHHALLISGSLDVRTPIEDQLEAVQGLRNLTHLIVENGGHDIYEAHPLIPRLLVEYFSGRAIPLTPLRLPPPAVGK